MKQTLFVIWMVVCHISLVGQSIEDLSFGTDSTLEVMTWNIERFPKDGFTTIEYVADIIESLEVDLIALQEIDDQQSFDAILNMLGDWAGYWDDDALSGLAYIYNPDVIEVLDIFQIYQGENRPFPRPPLVMHCNYGGEYLVIINNHLKCCGNGILEPNDVWDEETRRRDAMELLDDYVEANHPDDQVIVLGDLNDMLTDASQHNVFSSMIDKQDSYHFADMEIAEGTTANWSYPGWPSHLDHLLVTNELFVALDENGSTVATIRVDDYIGGFTVYDSIVSDHRPVAMRLLTGKGTTSVEEAWDAGQVLAMRPNPFIGQGTFVFEPLSAAAEIVLLDISGNEVTRIPVGPGETSAAFHGSGLPSGVYFAHLIAKGITAKPAPVVKLR